MEKGRLEILKADMGRQTEIIEQIYAEIQKRNEGYETNMERMESLAYQIHNLYCAFEDLMRIVANEFENRVSERSDWHIQLPRRMTEKIPNIRPALFSQECYLHLDELRSFRHWFRHACSYKIEPEKLAIVLKKAVKLKEKYKIDINKFLQELSGRIQE